MKVNNKSYRAIWVEGSTVCMIEQNLLPFEFKIHRCNSVDETCHAIKTMIVRGAGSIGAAGGYAMLQAIWENKNAGNLYSELEIAKQKIDSTRPTAVNLFYATNRVLEASKVSKEFAISEAYAIADECVEQSKKIGVFGNELIKDGYKIETHCNAGWLALVDYGSALSPIYTAFETGKKNIFVFVDETRPRLQGMRLTAWELQQQGVPHAIIPDNAGAFYMSKGEVDIMITGADRIATNGDTANKIGTLEKAIAAKYYGIPFYIAAPSSTFDLNTKTGNEIIIEERDEEEVLYFYGKNKENKFENIFISNPGSRAKNPAFDVTPAELITGFITEKGIIKPNEEEIKKLLTQ
ncbi:MAG: S-methyl-5-thioribose-1-phosphate isomerase [Dysgonamonadaceae bacterium]|jgi:S-methyl-5-thioribose-1-phosphate isomerase|nr:S-methyl-5-thioribose-1-phosphate isomerase [Dysgonamonadaceae bacterium]